MYFPGAVVREKISEWKTVVDAGVAAVTLETSVVWVPRFVCAGYLCPWEEGTAVEELLPSDWPVGMSVGFVFLVVICCRGPSPLWALPSLS